MIERRSAPAWRSARSLARQIGLAVVLLAAAAPCLAQTNVVIFVADDLGWGDVGYHGSEIRTPTIDRLAAEGMRLERFYVQPVCSPTRSALMTGRSPLRTGVLIPFEPWFSRGLPTDEKLLPQYFRDAGHQTFAVGKWHLGPNERAYHPLNRGFDHFYGHLGGFINYNLHTIWRGVDWQRNGATVHEEGYATHLIADEAVRLIENRDPDAPMLLYVAFNAPHSPLQAPASAIAEYADIDDEHRRTFAAMTSEMDRGIGRILAALEAEGLSDDTLVLFMSDNGGAESLGARNGELRGGKGDTWEGGIRVPAVLWWSGEIEAGSAYEHMISAEDLLPTLATAAGLSPQWAKPLDGRDQWPALRRGSPPDDYPRVAARQVGPDLTIAYIKNGWKLVRMIDGNGELRTHLFRIYDDPEEREDLVAERPDLVAQLSAELDALPRGPVAGMEDRPPDLFGVGGPLAPLPDDRPPNREPYAEAAGND